MSGHNDKTKMRIVQTRLHYQMLKKKKLLSLCLQTSVACTITEESHNSDSSGTCSHKLRVTVEFAEIVQWRDTVVYWKIG